MVKWPSSFQSATLICRNADGTSLFDGGGFDLHKILQFLMNMDLLLSFFAEFCLQAHSTIYESSWMKGNVTGEFAYEKGTHYIYCILENILWQE